MPSIGAERSAARERQTISLRAASRVNRSCAQPRSSAKSSEPKATATTPCEARIAGRFASPAALSTNAMTLTLRPMRLVMPAMSSGRSALGSMIAMPSRPRAASISAACQGVPAALTRTITGDFSAPACATTACRALSLSAGATASSRSRMTASAPLVSALANLSGREPGTKSGTTGVTKLTIAPWPSPSHVRRTPALPFPSRPFHAPLRSGAGSAGRSPDARRERRNGPAPGRQ